MRRFLRIYPLYYGFLLLFFFVLMPIVNGVPVPSMAHQMWSWCFLENVPLTFHHLVTQGPLHYWSLAVEEHFYLFWPLLIWSLPLQGLRNLTCGILLVEPLGRFFSLKFFGLSLYFFTFGRLDSLAYGALLAILLAGNQYRQDLLTPLFRTLLILLSLVLPAFFWAVSGYGIAWVQAVKLSLIPAFYFSLMGFCLVDPKSYLLTRLLSVAWLRRLGVISYGIYVYHSACFDVIIKYSHPSTFWLKAVSSVGLTLIVSELSFRFFESPILKLKRHFQYETCSSG